MSTSLCIDTQDWLGADCVSIGDTGGGVLGSSIPSNGDAGSGFAYPMLQVGDMGKEICGRVVTVPAGLTLYAYEDTSSIASANDGTYVMYYQPYIDYVAFGAPLPVTYTFGAANATAPGAVLTGVSLIVPGSATGTSAGTAPGASLTATSVLAGGAAAGMANGAAPGVDLAASSSLLPGVASGMGNAAAPGAALTSVSVLVAGAATGNLSAAAPGAVMGAIATLIAGAAAGNLSAIAPGAALVAAAALSSGGAYSATFARAPAGSGYAPRRDESTTRPAATQRNYR